MLKSKVLSLAVAAMTAVSLIGCSMSDSDSSSGKKEDPIVTYQCDFCSTVYATLEEAMKCDKTDKCPGYVDDTVKYYCSGCDTAYDTEEEAAKCDKTENCPGYTAPAVKHNCAVCNAEYDTEEEAAKCDKTESCPGYTAPATKYNCAACNAEYDTEEEAAKCDKTESCPGYVAPVSTQYSYDFKALLAGVEAADKTDASSQVFGDVISFSGSSVVYRVSSGEIFAVELGKKSTGVMTVVVPADGKLVISTASTGGTNVTDSISLKDASGNDVAEKDGVTSVTGSSPCTDLTYEVTAGTYTFSSACTGRGVRVHGVTLY